VRRKAAHTMRRRAPFRHRDNEAAVREIMHRGHELLADQAAHKIADAASPSGRTGGGAPSSRRRCRAGTATAEPALGLASSTMRSSAA